MARKRDRIFAISVAALFFISAFGFSFWVIWEAVSNNSSSTTGSAATAASCSDTPSPTALTLTPPATAYVPTSPPKTLQIADLVKGNGKTAASGDCLIVKYYGTLATSGIVFDENYTTTQGFEFQLGQGNVIPGWDQGLVGMKVGGTRRLVIPSALAYGTQSPSKAVPANSNLVFVVYLVTIK
jgi:FKBP-type peptidyl-prolyl cis-trans isomerase